MKDTGFGIPQDHLNRVFERFFRVDKSRSKERGGTGLGLAIVKHIMEAHNSKVTVSSVDGEGSVLVLNYLWIQQEYLRLLETNTPDF